MLSGESGRVDAAGTVNRGFDPTVGEFRAEISFVMCFLSRCVTEKAKTRANGAAIGAGTVRWQKDAPDRNLAPPGGIPATAERTSSIETGSRDASTRGTDQVYKIGVAVDHPGGTRSLGIGTALDPSQADEPQMIDDAELNVGP